MDLNKITTQVRPRTHWQAVDLGFKMGKQWYLELFKGYLVIGLPIFILFNILFTDLLWVSLILVWWFKPIIERIQLIFLSRALFGQTLDLKQQIAILLQAPKAEWIASLVTQRISLHRSYYSPIRQLENQRGKDLSRRKQAFNGQNDKAAFWLTFVLVHIESFIVFGALTLISFLVPEQVDFSIDIFSLEQDVVTTTIYNNALVFLSYALIAPFYTSAGFSLYLNQRTHIEGWDIEISFKRLIARTEQNRSNKVYHSASAAKSIFIAMLIGCLASFSEPSMAQTTQADASKTIEKSPKQQQAQKQIKAIIESETFNQKEIRSYPEAFLNLETDGKKYDKQSQFKLPEWLHSITSALSSSIEWLLTLFVLGIIIIFCVRYRHWFAQFLPEGAMQNPPSQYKQMFGLDLPEQSDLENVPNQARDLWSKKQKREALSLLYRASLQVLVNQEHIKLNDAFTEGECVRQVKQTANKTISQYFKVLTNNWQRLAYANQEPNDATLTRLIEQWSEVFVSSIKDSQNSAQDKDGTAENQQGGNQ